MTKFAVMQEKQLFIYLIDTLWKWRKHLIIALAFTAIAVSLVMLNRPNFYRASTIFYPASTSIQKPVFTEAERNINYYGDDHDVDRMLSIATSNDTKLEVIEELKLREHYGLGNDQKSTERLHKLFGKMYKVIKTEYDAIRISFEDVNPETASTVANYARGKVDTKTQDIIKSAQRNVLKNAEKSLEIIQSEVDDLKENLKTQRKKYGVYNTQSQAEAFAIMDNRNGNSTKIERQVKDYTEGISLVKSLEDQIEFTTENLVKYQSNTYRLRSALESEISAMHIVQQASTPVSKAGPFRSVYVLGALLIMALLSALVILIIEELKK